MTPSVYVLGSNQLGKKRRCVPLGLTGKLVEEDGDTVDGPAALEVRLDLLRRSRIVDVSDKDAPTVDILLVLGELVMLLVQTSLHLAELGGLLFHLGDTALHGRDLLLFTIT